MNFLLQYSTLYMKHAKRKKLTTEDFNKALKQSDVQVCDIQFIVEFKRSL